VGGFGRRTEIGGLDAAAGAVAEGQGADRVVCRA